MEKKQTAVDILFQEIKESDAFLPDNLFDYLEMVYNKAKEIEKEQMIDFLDSIIDYTKESHNILGVSDDREAKDYFEQYYNETYKQQDND